MSSFLLKNPLLVASATGHFTIEVFSGLLPVMYPTLISTLGLSYAQVGGLTSMFMLAAAAPQPLFGYLSDRFGSHWFSSVSVLWLVAFIAAASLARDYSALILLVTVAGLASAAFHPAGATNAARANQAAKGNSLSIFLASGNIGYAVGPVIGAAVFTAVGPKGAGLLILPALLVTLFIYRVTAAQTKKMERPAPQVAPDGRERLAVRGLVALAALMSLRSWLHVGFASYTLLLLVERNMTLLASSRILSLLLLSVAMGTLLGGFAADHLERRLVLFAALSLSAPANLLFLMVPDWVMPVAAPLTGLFIGIPIPIILLVAQDLLPKRVGVASGLALGIAHVGGSLGAALTGVMAEHYTLFAALLILGLTPLLSSLCALALPAGQSAPRTSL